MTNQTIKYGYHEETDYDMFEAKKPEKHIVDQDVAYFAGPDGFLWVCMEFDAKGQFDWEHSGNCRLQDEFNFSGALPDSVETHGEGMAEAITVILNVPSYDADV